MTHWIAHLEGGPRRVNHAAVFIKSHIFSFGGYCTGGNFEVAKPIDIHALNIYTYRWTLVQTFNELDYQTTRKSGRHQRKIDDDDSDTDHLFEEVPFHRYGHTAVNWKDRAYIFGGRNDRNGACNKLFCFDPETLRWSRVSTKGEVPGARDGHSASVLNDKMYLFGGYEDALQRFSNDMYTFDFRLSQWSLLSTTGTPPIWRDFHTSSVIKNFILIFGGRSDEAGQFHTNSEVYCNKLVTFDTTTNVWTQPKVKGYVPYGRRSHTAFVYRDEMYIFGGYNSLQDVHFADMHKFNLESNLWVSVRVYGRGPGVRRRHCCCVVDDDAGGGDRRGGATGGSRVFLFGGTRPSSLLRPLPMSLQPFVLPTDELLVDLSDLHVLQFKPSLKTLSMLVIIEKKLDTSCLPAMLRFEMDISRLPASSG